MPALRWLVAVLVLALLASGAARGDLDRLWRDAAAR